MQALVRVLGLLQSLCDTGWARALSGFTPRGSHPACRLEEDIGLELVDEEETSKVFPASHSSRDVRDSLVEACVRQGVEFRYNASVEGLQQLPDGGGWRCRLADGSEHRTQRLVSRSACVAAGAAGESPVSGSLF